MNGADTGLAIALLVVLFLCGVYDIWITTTGRPEKTVSTLLQQWSVTFPALPLAVGFLMGHLFWPLRR